MNLYELKNIIDASIGDRYAGHRNPKDISVLITLSERSVGARAACDVYSANMGFDWEHNQFRISPDFPLVHKGNTLKDIKPQLCEKIDGRSYYFCSRCEGRVSKTDKYCRSCGQRMK